MKSRSYTVFFLNRHNTVCLSLRRLADDKTLTDLLLLAESAAFATITNCSAVTKGISSSGTLEKLKYRRPPSHRGAEAIRFSSRFSDWKVARAARRNRETAVPLWATRRIESSIICGVRSPTPAGGDGNWKFTLSTALASVVSLSLTPRLARSSTGTPCSRESRRRIRNMSWWVYARRFWLQWMPAFRKSARSGVVPSKFCLRKRLRISAFVQHFYSR